MNYLIKEDIQQEKVVERELPKLVRGKLSGIIFLVIEEKEGRYLCIATTGYNKGHFNKFVDKSMVESFNGTLTLSNN